MWTITINGRVHDVAGGTVLEAVRRAGISLPTLCHDDRLPSTGSCRLCLVNVRGSARPVPACATPVADGMAIETHTPELEEYRRWMLRLIAWRYPAEPVARFPDKPFHRLLREYDLIGELHGRSDPALVDGTHPCVTVDMSLCVHCDRCVRMCAEARGRSVWHPRGRGADIALVADGSSLRASSCVSCGGCADTCPTGAIEHVSTLERGPADAWTRTVCPYCGTGCEIEAGTRNGRLVAMRAPVDAPVNRGHLCAKGRYGFEFVDAPDRVTEPMIRSGGEWTRVTWADAYGFIAERISGIVSAYGPDSVGILGSARATNEDNYVTQKLARTVIGTNNVDCCARVCHAPSATALKRMLGSGLGTNAFDDIESARAILLCGANATENHPIVGARIRRAARRGAALIVIDPRRIELANDAACHLAPRPGTNVALLNAMAHTIALERLSDRGFLENRVDGVDAFIEHVRQWTPERAARLCGVDAAEIRYAARLYAANAPAMIVHGLGVTEQEQGTDGVMALINLALLTGNIGTAGGGVNPLRGQNNVQGAAHMGCEPGSLPGSMPLEDGIESFEAHWNTRLPTSRGLTLLGMMDAAAAGRLKALWAIGYDVAMTNAHAGETARALGSLDLLVVQDLFLNETARAFANVFLPACSSFEKEGTFMTAERRIQRVRAALPPAGASKPDWLIVAELAQAMNASGFDFSDPRQIWDEIRAACPGARGMTYPRLDAAGLQWPCVAESDPGTPILHAGGFPAGRRARLQCLAYQPSTEKLDAEFPLLLVTGRSLYQFNAGTMTGRGHINDLRPSDRVDVSPADAVAAGLHDGDRATIVSRHGSAIVPVHVSGSVLPGQLFATFQTPGIFLNRVTAPYRDAVTGTPAYKVTAVRIARAA